MHRDFTTGNPTRLLLRFSLPLALSIILQSLYNTVDTIIVGRLISEEALAAVGTTGSVSMLVSLMIFGVTTGISVVVSQFNGAQEAENVKRTVATSLYLIVGLSIFFSLVGIVFSRQLLKLINVPENILADATIYLRIIFGGTIASAMYSMAASLARALGDSTTPMIIIILCSVLHIGLAILFIAGFSMGVTGVAYATVLSTALSAIACWVIVWKRMPILHPTRETIKPDRAIMKVIIKIGIPSALQSSTMLIGDITVQSIVNGFGSTVIAAYSVATKIVALVSYAPEGVTQAMQVFTGQNVGAGLYDRVRVAFRSAAKVIVFVSLLAGVALVLWGQPLLGIFTASGGQMIEIGYVYLVITGLGTAFCGLLYLTRCTLTGAGDAMAAIYISLVELVVRIGCSFLLARHFGYIGAFIGTVPGWVAGAAFGYFRYKQNKWVNKGLIQTG